MFNIGDKIIYGQTGVCIIEDICEKTLMRNVTKLYYTLKPLYQNNNVIYAPVDNEKVFMRNVITKNEAEDLVKLIPDIRQKAIENSGVKTESIDYKANFESHKCKDLIELAMYIYAKKQVARSQKKKIGFIDEKYMKKAEDLLFGELAIALEIPIEDVPKIIFKNLTAN